MKNFKNMKVGSLEVIDYSRLHTQPCGAKVHYWKVRCDCGKVFERKSTHLSSKQYKLQSCGCANRKACGDRFRTHGLKKHMLYNVWANMINRCHNPKDKFYKDYGGRGIFVCKRWLKIENFLEDMGEKPIGKQIDRIDNNKGYSKGNCRWVTSYEQCRNKRNNRLIKIDDEIKCVTDWCAQYKISIATVCNRIKSGWDDAVAVIAPKTNKWETGRGR